MKSKAAHFSYEAFLLYETLMKNTILETIQLSYGKK
jgi:hypothetical protein